MADFYEKEPVSLYLSQLSVIEEIHGYLQKVQLFKHEQLGKVLIINDEIQHIEKWMPYYHESIVHIPMMFIEVPKKVLILGGGDLFAAYEVLKYNSVEELVLCDFDINVIDLTSKYYEHAEYVINDKRFNLIIQDAKEYIENCNTEFDLIIDDCFNLVKDFETGDIFLQLKSCLSSNGICSSLVYRHIFDSEIMGKTFARLINKQRTVLSLIAVPEYPGILHLLTMWGNNNNLSQNLDSSFNIEHRRHTLKCLLFNSLFCHYYLYLPNYLENWSNKYNDT